MDLKLDEGLKALIDSGKRKGFLTFVQVNDVLPDDAANSEKLDQLLLLLEEHGIELIEESEAEEREAGPAAANEDRGELDLSFLDEDDGRRDRRPGPHVPHPDGRNPAAQAGRGNRPRQEDRSHPQALPPQGAGMRLRPPQRRRDAQARPLRRPAVRPHGQGVADREPGEGQDPPADAAQPEDARTPDGAERRGLQEARRPPDRRGGRKRNSGGCSRSAAARRSRWSKNCRSARRKSSR